MRGLQLLFLFFVGAGCTQTQQTSKTAAPAVPAAPASRVVMHNVILHENDVRLRIRWLRGTLVPTRKNVTPSFDEPASFALNIQDGAAAISLTDLSSAMNKSVLTNTSLRDVKLSQSGTRLRINGTIHKGVALPVEIASDVDAAPDGRVRLHIASIRVLKIPVKGLLNAFEIKTADVIDSRGARGLEVKGDDIYIDPEQLLPEPRKRGKLTDVHLDNGSVVEFYGSARNDIVKTREWRNFISIRGGSLEFGKLGMTNADVVMIDLSQDAWFDFDLSHYQRQLVNGTIRLTPQAGLRILMPDLDKIPANASNRAITSQWMKNRNLTPPDDLTQ
jgi:hypothetical protein